MYRFKTSWVLSTSILAIGVVASLFLVDRGFLNTRTSEVAAAAEVGSSDCQTAIKVAILSFNSPSCFDVDSPIVDDKCVGAVYDSSRVQPGEQDPEGNPKNYKCVGKYAKLTEEAGGTIRECTNPDPNLPPGVCSAQYCDANGACHAAQQAPTTPDGQQAPQQPQTGSGLLDGGVDTSPGIKTVTPDTGLLNQLDQQQTPPGSSLPNSLPTPQTQPGTGLLEQFNQQPTPQTQSGTGLLDGGVDTSPGIKAVTPDTGLLNQGQSGTNGLLTPQQPLQQPQSSLQTFPSNPAFVQVAQQTTPANTCFFDFFGLCL